jgi:hypothetical protein
MASHSYSHFIEIGRTEVELVIGFTVEPGFAGDRIDPPYPASAEVQTVTVVTPKGREAAPKWLFDLIAADEGLCDDMLNDADDGPDWDAIRDMRRDDALTVRAA